MGRGRNAWSPDAPVLPWRSVVADAARAGDEDARLAVLDGLKDRAPAPDVLRDVAEILWSTQSRRVRNTAALALADGGLAEMSEPIVATLRDERVAREAGTLLFALDELGGVLPLDAAAHIIAKGSYEARAEALFFFELGRIDRGGDETCRSTKATLTGLLSGEDAEASEAAGLALGFLGTTD